MADVPGVAAGKERPGLRLFVERLGCQVDAVGPDDGASFRIDGDLGKYAGSFSGVSWRCRWFA